MRPEIPAPVLPRSSHLNLEVRLRLLEEVREFSEVVFHGFIPVKEFLLLFLHLGFKRRNPPMQHHVDLGEFIFEGRGVCLDLFLNTREIRNRRL